MKIQLGNNLKVFLTTNLDSTGKVLTTGFTVNNTRQISIVTGSLSASQEKSYQYLDSSNLMDPSRNLEVVANSTLELGSLNLSTTFNTSAEGPFDAWLWNALVNDSNYPAGKWTIGSTHTLGLVRNATRTYPLGVVIVSEDLVYLFDAVRISGLGLSFDLDSVLVSNWTCGYESYTCLDTVVFTEVLQDRKYTLQGGLTGALHMLDHSKYLWGNSKLVKVYVSKQSEAFSENTLASIGIELNIANTQSYIEDSGFNRTKLAQIYSNAGSYTLSGTVNMYTRSGGSYSHELVKEIVSYKSDPFYKNTYNILLELMSSDTTKLCDIQLKSCNLQATTEFSTTLTDTINFKVIEGPEAQDCFIKFYT